MKEGFTEMETINNANSPEVIAGQEFNANGTEVVTVQESNAGSPEVVTGQEGASAVDAGSMSKEEFEEYISSLEYAEERNAGAADNSDNSVNNPSENREGKGKTEPFKVFNTQEELQGYFNERLGKRLAEVRQQEDKYKKLGERFDGMMAEVKAFYNTDDNDKAYEMLVNDMREQTANKRGVDLDTYLRQQETERKAKAFDEYSRMQESSQAQQEQIKEIQNKWLGEAEELKKTVPDFDFQKMMSTNQEFKERMARGYSVADAFRLAVPTNPPATARVQRKPVSQVGASGGMTAGSQTVRNPANLPKKEFEEYVSRIMDNG